MKIVTIDEMRTGLLAGRVLIQEEWADQSEIEAVDALVKEGFAQSTAWTYSKNLQCESRRVRLKGTI